MSPVTADLAKLGCDRIARTRYFSAPATRRITYLGADEGRASRDQVELDIGQVADRRDELGNMRDGRSENVVRENNAVSSRRDPPHDMRNPSAVLIVRAPVPGAKVPKHRFVSESLGGAIDDAVVKTEWRTKHFGAVVERTDEIFGLLDLLFDPCAVELRQVGMTVS